MATHNETGKKGEQLALEWLVQEGYQVLETNWRFSRYEIDIIATKTGILHIIEVKTRRNLLYGYPEQSVSARKMQSLQKGTEEYLRLHPQWKRIQYDILSVLWMKQKKPDFLIIPDVYMW